MKNKKMILSIVGAILEVVGGIGTIIGLFAEVMPDKKLERNKTEVQ